MDIFDTDTFHPLLPVAITGFQGCQRCVQDVAQMYKMYEVNLTKNIEYCRNQP
nr:MAG TPA: hypothetical protein [Caudoviricetes sp.]